MNFTPKADIPIQFVHSQVKPINDRFVPNEYKEQAFQTIRTQSYQDNFDIGLRSRSADRQWGAGTFGRGDEYYPNYPNNRDFRDYEPRNNVITPMAVTANFKELAYEHPKQAAQKNSELKSELQELREIIRAEAGYGDRDNGKKVTRDYKLKVDTTQRRPFVVPGSGSKLRPDSKLDTRNARSPPRREEKQMLSGRRSYDEHRESEKKSPRVPVQMDSHREEANTTSYYSPESNEKEEREIREVPREVEGLIRENKLKDRKIEELERQMEDLRANVDIYRTRLTGHLEVVKKELMEGDLYVLKLRESLYMLSEHNIKIIGLSQRTKTVEAGNSMFELGQEIEKNRTIWDRMHSEMEKMSEHIKASEERTRKLWDLVSISPYELVTDISRISAHGSLESNFTGKYKYEDGFEVQKLKEDLRVYADALSMKDKTVKRLTGQVRDMEELIAKYLKTENGQLNNGLKNTARKLIELQNKLEKSNSEREGFENQVVILKRENEGLQSDLSILEKEKQEWKSYEKALRETKTELKKCENKNEVLTEINTKNEVIIMTLKSLVSDLRAERQVAKVLEGYKPELVLATTPPGPYTDLKHGPLPYTFTEPGTYKLETTVPATFETQTKTLPTNFDGWDYKNQPLLTKLDDPLERKSSGNSNVYEPYSKNVLPPVNIGYEDPHLEHQSYSRDLLNESKLKYADPTLERPSSYLNANMRIAESFQVNTPLSTYENISQNQKLEPFNLESYGIHGVNFYKDKDGLL